MLKAATETLRAREGIAGRSWVRATRRPPLRSAANTPLAIVDLFCGCGGLSLGAWEAARLAGRRIDVRLAVDFGANPLAVYRANLGCDDTRAVQCGVEHIFDGNKNRRPTANERKWIERIGETDLIVAGPPCQGHSDLNNSTRRNDPRNSLYLRVARAVELLKPKVVLIENVPAVVHDSEGVVDCTRDWLEQSGYGVVAATVSFARFGLPQLRRRHILIGTRENAFDFDEILAGTSIAHTVGDFLGGIEDEPSFRSGVFYQPAKVTSVNQRRIDFLFRHNVHNLPDKMRPSCHRDKAHAYVSMYGRMYWDRPAQTLTSGFGSMGQGRYVHPLRSRLLTPHEAARLQGFPDFFNFSVVDKVTALREMIANAVPPQFTAVLLHALLDRCIL